MPFEIKQKISKSLTGLKNPNYNKKMSEEQKDKIRQTKLSLSVEKRNEISKNISNSLKIYNKNLIINSKTSKQIAQCNEDGTIIRIYNSISQASKELNIDRTTISRCCSDKYTHYKTCKGFIWKYYNKT